MPKSIQAAAEGVPKLTTPLQPRQMPEQYCMQAMGTCMEPVYPDGSKLLFSSTERYRYGDDVIIWFRPEFVRPGEHQLLIKRLVVAPRREYWLGGGAVTSNIGPTVIVEMLNPRQMLQFHVDTIMGIHKCLGLVPAGMKTYKVKDEEFMQPSRPRELEVL